MNAEEEQRFSALSKGPCVPPDYVCDYYGLAWPLPSDVRPDFEQWQSQRRLPSNCGQETISRYELEAFMAQRDAIPKKWMAAKLGMEVASLDDVLLRLKDIGMLPQRYALYSELISESLDEDLIHNLPGLRFRTFSDHNSFCLRLHAEIEKLLGIIIKPLFCSTSDRVQDYPREFASDFDCITLAPLSGKHQVWLDFRKPLNLGPDRCSKLFYAENRDTLRPYCAGTHEPDDLEAYLQFLQESLHG